MVCPKAKIECKEHRHDERDKNREKFVHIPLLNRSGSPKDEEACELRVSVSSKLRERIGWRFRYLAEQQILRMGS
jgi:hypothetical protein